MLPEVYYSTLFEIPAGFSALGGSFAIVTAYNPMDEKLPDEINHRHDQQLKIQLRQAGYSPFRTTGCSPDNTHEEPGWGFVASLKDAVDIARTFRQRALWWIVEDRLHLVDCSDPEPVFVDLFSSRIMQKPG